MTTDGSRPERRDDDAGIARDRHPLPRTPRTFTELGRRVKPTPGPRRIAEARGIALYVRS